MRPGVPTTICAPCSRLAVCGRIGVPPQFCRAYEDTDLGMQAIRAAGMHAMDVRELRILSA